MSSKQIQSNSKFNNQKAFQEFQETAILYTKLFNNSQQQVQENHTLGQISMLEQTLKQILQNKDLKYVQFPQLLQSMFNLSDKTSDDLTHTSSKQTQKQHISTQQIREKLNIKCNKTRVMPNYFGEQDDYDDLLGTHGRMVKKVDFEHFNDQESRNEHNKIQQQQNFHDTQQNSDLKNSVEQNDMMYNQHNFMNCEKEQPFAIDSQLQNFNFNDELSQDQEKQLEEDSMVVKKKDSDNYYDNDKTQILTSTSQKPQQNQQKKRKFYKLKGQFWKQNPNSDQNQQQQQQQKQQNNNLLNEQEYNCYQQFSIFNTKMHEESQEQQQL